MQNSVTHLVDMTISFLAGATMKSFVVLVTKMTSTQCGSLICSAQFGHLRSGLLKAVQLVLRITESGLLFGGPPCSSWIWVSIGTHKRTRERPNGANTDFVHQANRRAEIISSLLAARLTSRWVLLMFLATCRGVWSLYEQPGSSIMPWYACMKRFQRAASKHVSWQNVFLPCPRIYFYFGV